VYAQETVHITDGVDMELKSLEYAPLPWQTHPIDTTPCQSQGWGPMSGPYTPYNYNSAKDCMTGGFGLDTTRDLADNRITYAPSYNVLTLMQDKSISYVNNAGMTATMMQEQGPKSFATIAQADNVQLSGVTAQASAASHGFWQGFRSLITHSMGGAK